MYAVRITHFFSENTEELQRFRNALVRISEGVESRSIPSESGECDYEVLQRELGILEDELETGRGFIVSISDMQEDTTGPFFIVQAQDCWRAKEPRLTQSGVGSLQKKELRKYKEKRNL